MVQVGNPCNRHAGYRYRGSTGNNVWQGAGQFFLTGSPDFAKGKGYNPTGQAKFWVMGAKSSTGIGLRRSLGSGWPLDTDKSLFKPSSRASRFVISDSHFSEYNNGKPVCDPILFTANPVSQREHIRKNYYAHPDFCDGLSL